MSKLTTYWALKKFALDTLLKASDPVKPETIMVQKWFDNITVKPAATTSPEYLLEKALTDLDVARAVATEKFTGNGANKKENSKRRSQRLLRLVQGAIGDAGGNSSGFSATIGDLHPGGGLGGVDGDYYRAASNASEKAAVFLSAVKSELAGSDPFQSVLNSLRAIRAAAPASVAPFLLECIDGLILSMDGFVKNGGGGEGSGYWPSTIISSSSSSGG